MGKDWARGLSKATDPRIARNAEARLDRPHRRNRRPEVDRRRTTGGARFRAPATNDDWTPALAYAAGLAATDGCLSKDRKTVAQVSADRDSLETFKQCVGSGAPISPDGGALRVQIVDVGFYDWLASLGLTPRKSLTLGAVNVPDRFFPDLVRGLLDGDGSVLTSVVVPNPRRYPDHRYERLRVQFHTASERHALWLRSEIQRRFGLAGWLGVRTKGRDNPYYLVRYSKHDSMALLDLLYADPSAPRLDRKWRRWLQFRDHRRPTRKWHRRKPV